MKKVRVELGVILEIGVDEQDEEKARAIAKEMAMATLYNNYTGECVLDNEQEGIYVANADANALECEEDDDE